MSPFSESKSNDLSCESISYQKRSYNVLYRRYLADDTGAALGGSLFKFLEERCVHPLVCEATNNGGDFEFLLDYGGVRYHLLLTRNREQVDCAENTVLQGLYDAMDVGDPEREEGSIAKCLDLFWSRIKDDFAKRGIEASIKYEIADRYAEKRVTRIQLRTTEDGDITWTEHSGSLKFPRSDPIDNPWMSYPRFDKSKMRIVEELSPDVLKAEIGGALYCLKLGPRSSLLREITALAELPSSPNLPHLVGLVNAGDGKVNGLAMALIEGKSLDCIRRATSQQKSTWKREICSAVQLLHKKGIVWGDVKPDNIMIDQKTDRPVLIDFGGGHNPEWVDSELAETTMGDLQGVSRVIDYIDRMKP